MVERPCSRAQRVAGAPKGVVAWIDHDRRDDLLLLNADRFTAQEEQAITAILAQGVHTPREVAHALAAVPGGY